LFELVLRLRRLEVRCGVPLHIIHVAGTRMIRQGADGLLRGSNTLEGVMGGFECIGAVQTASSMDLVVVWKPIYSATHAQGLV
jgi:hypothetical protein